VLSPDERAWVGSLLPPIPVWEPLPGPQTMAYNSEADIIGYGGAAGGGKTDLICGLALTRHKRALIARREKAQTEGIIQRLMEIKDGTQGYNSQKGVWRMDEEGALLEFAGLDDPGDERRWQGRPHDLKAFDEVTEMREAQVRFVMGWLRSADPNVRCQVLMTFNPPTTVEGRWVLKFFAPWLDPSHPKRAAHGELRWFTTENGADVEVPDNRAFVRVGDERVYDFDPSEFTPQQIIVPKSRTFIPAKVSDNPFYMASGYMSTLQALPEPLRSQMLNGDFLAGVKDDAWQLIPTAWVEAAQARWVDQYPKPPMDSMGIDVARGGDDKTIIYRRHGMWIDHALVYPGKETPDGPSVAAQVLANARDSAIQHIDIIGVGASPYDFLVQANAPVQGVDVRQATERKDRTGKLSFFNLRSALGWWAREIFDPANNTGIMIPPSAELKADLCAIRWSPHGRGIKVESREEIIKRLGRSPDHAAALFLALMDTPKVSDIPGVEERRRRMAEGNYDPLENVHQQLMGDYDPLSNI